MEQKNTLFEIRKLIFCILIIIFFGPSVVKGYSYTNFNGKYDSGNKLIYGISNVDLSASDITFTGWAFIDDMHTIGGKNNKISMLAIKESDYLADNLDELLYYDRDYVKAKSSSYTLKNAIYPTTCYRVGTPLKCAEVQYGFSRSGDTRPYASCKGGTTSCIHYDAGFSITFSISDLKSKLDLEETDRVVFIIRIEYDDLNTKSDGRIKVVSSGGSGCRFDLSDNTYKNCSKPCNNNRMRVASFHESVLNTDGKEFDKIINAKFDTKFINVTNFGMIHSYSKGVMTAHGSQYFEYRSSNNVFNISNSVMREMEETDLGIGPEQFRWYGLYVCDEDTAKKQGYYYTPVAASPTSNVKYGPSTWGIVDGEVFLGFTLSDPPPEDKCFIENTKNNSSAIAECENASYHSNCRMQVSIDELKTYDINGVGCKTGKKGTIKAYKVYATEEDTLIDIYDSTGDRLFKMGVGRKVWPGIKWDQQIEWLVNWKVDWDYYDDENKIYYSATRYYDSDSGPGVNCVKEPADDDDPAWVTEEYLLSKGSTEIKDYIITAKNKLDNKMKGFAESRWSGSGEFADGKTRSISRNNDALRLGFPKSDKYVTSPTYIDKDKIINVTQNKADTTAKTFEAEEKFNIKKAWLKGTDVRYATSNPGDYFDGGNYYYFPFDVPAGTELKFGLGLDFKSVVRNMSSKGYNDPNEKLVVWCKLTVDEGNLETKNYRVIDLSNPFPNNVPSKVANKAVNWEGFWNSKIKSNLNYLYDRIDSTSPEYSDDLYTVDLTPDSIDDIREYNKEQLESRPGKPESKTYINATLDEDGSSQFITTDFNHIIKNNPFSKFPISHVGEKGNDSP